jgi:murein DD-endopeptidase MepM/ murein hydrolase activator NlpD
MRVLSGLPLAWWLVPLALGLLAGETRAADATGGPGPRGSEVPKRGRPRAATTARPSPKAASVGSLAHVVRPGETLWQVARQHNVGVEALVRANRLPPGHRLRVGQRLAIPVSRAPLDSQEPPSPAEIVLDAPGSAPAVRLAWPVSGTIVSPFGPRGVAWHGGVDLQAERGADIRAAASGMVVQSGWERGYGHVVKIWHPGDLMTVYAHNQENLARVGDWVEQGALIATVGATGRATAPHLHFEIRLDGRKYNPLFWLSPPETLHAAAGASSTLVTGP